MSFRDEIDFPIDGGGFKKAVEALEDMQVQLTYRVYRPQKRLILVITAQTQGDLISAMVLARFHK